MRTLTTVWGQELGVALFIGVAVFAAILVAATAALDYFCAKVEERRQAALVQLAAPDPWEDPRVSSVEEVKTFVNFSNHPSKNWGAEQLSAAEKVGEVVDFKFPAVPADADADQVKRMASSIAIEILSLNPAVVMCQGEFTLAFTVAQLLKAAGVSVVAACSERKAVEEQMPDGTVKKTSLFEFVQFREF